MKGFLKILLFLAVFGLGAILLMKVIGFVVGIAMMLGIVALIAGLLYLFFGPDEKTPQKQVQQIQQPSAKSVEDELKRRRKEMQL